MHVTYVEELCPVTYEWDYVEITMHIICPGVHELEAWKSACSIKSNVKYVSSNQLQQFTPIIYFTNFKFYVQYDSKDILIDGRSRKAAAYMRFFRLDAL